MKKVSLLKMLVFPSLVLSGCTFSYSKSITKDAALVIINETADAYSTARFIIRNNTYETKLKIDTYKINENNERGGLVASEEIKATYVAPIPSLADDTTPYSLTYEESSTYVNHKELNSQSSLTVSKNIDGTYYVSENGSGHPYEPTSDTKIADLIEMPTSLIRKDSESALSIAKNFLESVDYLDASNPKTNTLTSFKAMSKGNSNLDITFYGSILQLRNIYNVEAVSEAVFSSFKVSMNERWISTIASDFTFPGSSLDPVYQDTNYIGYISLSFNYY